MFYKLFRYEYLIEKIIKKKKQNNIKIDPGAQEEYLGTCGKCSATEQTLSLLLYVKSKTNDKLI